MKRWKRLAGLVAAALAWAGVATADPGGAEDREGMTPQERRLTAHVSGAIFATHAAERAEAAHLGMEALAVELRDLRREVGGLQLAEARAEVVSGLAGAGPGATADGRPALRGRVDASLARLASHRAAVEAKLPELRSPRQRRLAQRALEKLAALEQEVREAAAAPAGERVPRLAGVKDRLVLEHFGLLQPPETAALSPTFQMVPEDQLPPVAED
jgi:hypothetical protein